MTLLVLEVDGCAMREQAFNAHHGSAILETHHISLEDASWIPTILVRVISIEERVPETLLFSVPSFKVKQCTRLSFLQLAPCNARCDGFTCIRHGPPPLLDCESVDRVASLLRTSLYRKTSTR